jgi:hypothetical protein
MLRPHGQPELAFRLNAHDQREQELAAAEGPLPLRRGEQCTGDGARGVDDGVEVRVVVVVHVRGDAVEERGVLGVDAVRRAEERGRGGAEEGG